MSPLILFALIAGLPVLFAVLFRVSSVFLFLSVVAGGLLVTSIGDDVLFALDTFIKSNNAASIVNLALLGVPVLLTLFFLRKTMPRVQFVFHVVPLIAAGLMLATLSFDQFTLGVQGAFRQDQIGNIFYQAGDLIIAAAVVLNLLLAWQVHRHHVPSHKKHK